MKLDWLAGIIALAALAIALSGYLLWQSLQPRQNYAEFARPKPVVQPGDPLRPKTSGNPTDTSRKGSPVLLPPASEAAREDLKNIQALEKETLGSYEDRITPLRRFVASHPGTAESRQAQEWLKAWEDESRAFRTADELERKAGAKMCSILRQWRDFLAHQTTGLRRAYARERIRHWEKEVQEYAGYADLTVHSATGLPVSDTTLFGRGQPDPYFVLLEGDKILYRSPTFNDNSAPEWDASVRIYLSPGVNLTLEIWDEDFVGRDLLLGQALMSLPLDGPFQITQGPIIVNLEIQRDK